MFFFRFRMVGNKGGCTVHWFRKGLRIHDNAGHSSSYEGLKVWIRGRHPPYNWVDVPPLENWGTSPCGKLRGWPPLKIEGPSPPPLKNLLDVTHWKIEATSTLWKFEESSRLGKNKEILFFPRGKFLISPLAARTY